MEPPLYWHYWGKAKPASEHSAPYHLLPYHCLDVAAVASVWWDSSPVISQRFVRCVKGLSTEQLKGLAIFFVALHDYGKFDVRFQRKAPQVWERLNPDLKHKRLAYPTPEASKHFDHGRAGLFWFDKDQQTEADDESELGGLTSWIQDTPGVNTSNLPWAKAVMGHHGFVYQQNDMPGSIYDWPGAASRELASSDKAARQAWIAEMEHLFLQPVGLSIKNDLPPPSSLLAGFCSVSDWLGSRSDEEHFLYCAERTDDLSNYFNEKCQHDAQHVFALSGMQSHHKAYRGVRSLLKPGHKPRQVQTLVDELPSSPGLTIVEAPTGSGKTEMALAYGWRLIESRQAESIIFALPTQATANAMLKRLEKVATILFEDNPNLLLAHGNARFNKDFLALKHSLKTIQQQQEAWAQCNEWLGESRKRIFLGQIGVCTIDQVLVSVLPVRHRFIRGFGIGRSVLIVDEVHAYDAYMYGLLGAVLHQQHEAGGSSVLLSATLPSALRNDLIATCGHDLQTTTDASTAYPLISHSDGGCLSTYILPDAHRPPKRNVAYELIENEHLLPDEPLFQRIIDAAVNGAQVAIICNLVDVAQDMARYLQQGVAQSGLAIEVGIFHARYCLSHRQAKEEEILANFGDAGERTQGRILVATQVIEQSLDVDFDWIITQLCPIDLLFQRMGRLHRHEKNNPMRPADFKQALCTVLLPPGTGFGLHALIYSNTRVLWRTAQMLRRHIERPITFPSAYRAWIESVYEEGPWGDEPDEVETGFAKFEIDREGKRGIAKQMLKWAGDAEINDSDEKIRAVTRDSEFSLSLVPYLTTAKGKQLLSGKIYEGLPEVEQVEALAMSTVGVPQSWGKGRNAGFLPEPNDQGYIWLEMHADGDKWHTTLKNNELGYRPISGLSRRDGPKEPSPSLPTSVGNPLLTI